MDRSSAAVPTVNVRQPTSNTIGAPAATQQTEVDANMSSQAGLEHAVNSMLSQSTRTVNSNVLSSAQFDLLLEQ